MLKNTYLLLMALAMLVQVGCKSSISKQASKLPPEILKSKLFEIVVSKQAVKTVASSALPNSELTLWYVRYSRANAEAAHDKADLQNGYIFVFNNAQKSVDEALSKPLNQELGADKVFDQAFCGGLGSVDTDTFVPEKDGVKVEQFYAPGVERSVCSCILRWDSSTKKIIVSEKKQATDAQN